MPFVSEDPVQNPLMTDYAGVLRRRHAPPPLYDVALEQSTPSSVEIDTVAYPSSETQGNNEFK